MIRNSDITKIVGAAVILLTLISSFTTIAHEAYDRSDETINTELLHPSLANDTYKGKLRIYVVEPISRWEDDQDNSYEFGFFDFAAIIDLSIEYLDTYNGIFIWDGIQAGYDNIQEDNIMVITAVFNPESHQGYSDPPDGCPFDAYYVDAAAAATPGETGYNIVNDDFTHTVFCEEATSTGCPGCPPAREALHNIYESHDYPFYYVAMVYDNPLTHNRLLDDLNTYWVPTLYFDGGHRVLVGAVDADSRFRNAIESCGKRDIHELNLTVSLEWLGNGVIQIETSITNNERATTPLVTIGEITGEWDGFGKGSKISAEIKNIGDGDVTQVNWSISIVGGILDRIDIFDIGTIDSLDAGGLESIQTNTSVRGLGRVKIIVSAEGAEKTVNGFVLGSFIILR